MVDESRLSAAAAMTARVSARLPQAPLVVALSGGADSAVLGWIVAQSTDQARAVSVDHGLPGSATLMSAAAKIAGLLGPGPRDRPRSTFAIFGDSVTRSPVCRPGACDPG